MRLSPPQLDAVRQQMARDFPNENINVTFENDTAFVRGTVKDVIAADRVMAIAATLGKTVNLLRVEVPPVEQQILLKVRFANVDRSASTDLGVNLATGAFNQYTAIGTGQFARSAPTGTSFQPAPTREHSSCSAGHQLAAAIKALEGKRMLETLAEPNLLAINGKQASFLAGGEFPFPMVQPGAGGNAISITFREYGIRLNFLPTSRRAAPSSCRWRRKSARSTTPTRSPSRAPRSPALSTRRVQTEVELDSGQSFVIAGLMDNRMTETSPRSRASAAFRCSASCSRARPVTEQFRTAGDHDAGSGAAHSRRPAAARAEVSDRRS